MIGGMIFVGMAIVAIFTIVIRNRSFSDYKNRKPQVSNEDYEQLKDQIIAERMRRDAVKRFNSNQW